MAAMGSMGSRARLWLDTLSIALKRVLLMWAAALAVNFFHRWIQVCERALMTIIPITNDHALEFGDTPKSAILELQLLATCHDWHTILFYFFPQRS
jgi:hypothetical protein